MGSTMINFAVVMVTGLVNSRNFLAVFIALVIVFFLLGLILGLNINSRKKSSDNKQATTVDNSNENSRQTDTNRQEDWERSNYQNDRIVQKSPTNKNRNHYDYW